MPCAFTMRPETTFDLTTDWVVVDGDNVGTIAPFKGGACARVGAPRLPDLAHQVPGAHHARLMQGPCSHAGAGPGRG
jgi:hypothetical protein